MILSKLHGFLRIENVKSYGIRDHHLNVSAEFNKLGHLWKKK